MFQKGNKFWANKTTFGRTRIFSSPEVMWKASCEYFEWVETNPLWEMKAFPYQGEVTQEEVPKMRPMTVGGLCLFLDIGEQTLADYGQRDDFIDIVAKIKKVIYEQKFAGAAVDLFNANLISRDLGLKDVQAREHSGPDGGPVETVELSKEEYMSARQSMLEKDDC